MKINQIFASILLLIIAKTSYAQLNHLQWTATQVSANAQANEVVAFAVDAQGNSFSINATQDAGSFYLSNRLMSFDNTGVKKWDKQTDSCFTSCNEKYNCILPLGNGSVLFIGYKETVANVWELIVRKYNSNGVLVYKKYNVIGNGKPIKAVLDANNDIVVALQVDGITTGNDYSIAKCSSTNGSLLWQSTIPDAGTNGSILFETLSDIIIDNYNIYGIGMASNAFANVFDLKISKWDSTGAIIYSNTIANNLISNATIHAKIVSNQKGYLYALHNVNTQAVISKVIDSNATVVFNKIVKKDSAKSQVVDLKFYNHQLYVLGNASYIINDSSFQGFFETDKLYFINKLDTNCNTIFTKTYLTSFNQSDNNKGFGGAFQLEVCAQQLLVSSIQKKNEIDLPYYIIHKIDTAGNSIWYDSTKADVGQHIKIAMDAQCNAYLNYDAFEGLPTLHGIIKKYTDALSAPQNMNTILATNANVFYTDNDIQIMCDEAQIFSAILLNMHGQCIKKYYPNQQKILIEKNNVPSGVYMILIQTNKGAIGIKIQL